GAVAGRVRRRGANLHVARPGIEIQRISQSTGKDERDCPDDGAPASLLVGGPEIGELDLIAVATLCARVIGNEGLVRRGRRSENRVQRVADQKRNPATHGAEGSATAPGLY